MECQLPIPTATWARTCRRATKTITHEEDGIFPATECSIARRINDAMGKSAKQCRLSKTKQGGFDFRPGERHLRTASDQAATSLARWFLDRGCEPGDRIALYWPNSIAMAKLLFACFKAGLVRHAHQHIDEGPGDNLCSVRLRGGDVHGADPDFALSAREAARGAHLLRAVHSHPEEADEWDSGRSLPSVDKG